MFNNTVVIGTFKCNKSVISPFSGPLKKEYNSAIVQIKDMAVHHAYVLSDSFFDFNLNAVIIELYRRPLLTS